MLHCGVMARNISQVFEALCNLWLQDILPLVVETGDLTHTCPQACLCLFSLVFLQRRCCSQALHLLSSSYWNNVQNV